MKKFYFVCFLLIFAISANAQQITRTLFWNVSGAQRWPTLSNGRAWNDKRNWVDQNGNMPSTNVTDGDKLIIKSNTASNYIIIWSDMNINYSNFAIELQDYGRLILYFNTSLKLTAASTAFSLYNSRSGYGLWIAGTLYSNTPSVLMLNGIVKAMNTVYGVEYLYGSYTARGYESLYASSSGFAGFNFGSLPVTFSAFNAVVRRSGVELQWTVQQEWNVRHYSIERSADGQSWLEVGTVEASAFSQTTKDYTFVDANTAPGTWYYRLRANDLDGKRTYSALQAIRINNVSVSAIKMYPNPARSQVRFSIPGSGQPCEVRLYNQSGQLQWRKMVAAASTSVEVDVSALPAGYYLVNIAGAEGVQLQGKLIVKH